MARDGRHRDAAGARSQRTLRRETARAAGASGALQAGSDVVAVNFVGSADGMMRACLVALLPHLLLHVLLSAPLGMRGASALDNNTTRTPPMGMLN